MNTIASALLAVTIALGGAAVGPDDTETTASPQTTQSFHLPEPLKGALIYNPAGSGSGPNGDPEPVLELVPRDCSGDVSTVKPNLNLHLSTPVTIDDPDGAGQVVVEAGDYPGFRCDSSRSGIPFLVHPEYGAVEASQVYVAWTDAQVEAMLASAGLAGVVVEPVAAHLGGPITLRVEPGPTGEPLVVLTPGTQLEAVGLPIDGSLLVGQGLITPNYLPVRVEGGYTGWLPVPAVSTTTPGGLVGVGVQTEQLTVGTVAGALEDRRGLPVYRLDRATDLADPYLRQGTAMGYLAAGDVVTASTEMWEVPGGTGWVGLAVEASRISGLPAETQYLGRAGKLVELDGMIGWTWAFAPLDIAALSETAPTTEPTDAVPTIGAPGDDQATVTAPVAAQADPMTVPFTTQVERRGSKVGVPSTFSILSQATDAAPTLGVLAEGQVYRASSAFPGESSLTHGDLWRAVELADAEGTTTRAFVHADDVLETTRPAPTAPPTAGTGVVDKAIEKGGELGSAGVERWESRERGAWNPLRTFTNTVSLMVAIPLALAAAGMLCLGGYRASVVASGKKARRGLTGPGMLLALAPTAIGSALAVAAAWVAPSTATGSTIAGLLAVLAGAVVMMRMASRRGGLMPDLSETSWDRVVLVSAGPALLLGAVAWWLMGLMPAVVLAAVAAGAGISMAGARVETDDDESDGEASATKPDLPVVEKTSGPAEQSDQLSADPDELEGKVSADPYDLSYTSFETSQTVGSQPGRPTD